MSECEWIPQKLESNSSGLFTADMLLMPKPNLGKSGQPLNTEHPVAHIRGLCVKIPDFKYITALFPKI